MVISKRLEKDIQILTVVGSIDNEGKDYLANELESNQYDGIDKFVLDFSGVEYIGSIGVSTILSIYKRYQQKNQKLCIINLQTHLKKLFSITQLDKVIPLFEKIENASQYLAD